MRIGVDSATIIDHHDFDGDRLSCEATDNLSGGRANESLGKKGVLGERLGEKLGETRSRIVTLLAANPRISTREIAAQIGVSTTAIDKQIIVLKNKGVIKRVGPARGGHWEVLT